MRARVLTMKNFSEGKERKLEVFVQANGGKVERKLMELAGKDVPDAVCL